MKSNAGKESTKGMWRRTLKIYGSFRLPFHLYIIEVILGIVSTKVGLLYMPYLSKMQTGNIIGNDTVPKYIMFVLLNVAVGFVASIPTLYASNIVIKRTQNKLLHKIIRMPVKKYEQEGAAKLISHVTSDTDYVNQLITSVIGFITGIATAFMTLSEMNKLNSSLSWILFPVMGYVILSTWVEGKLSFLSQRRLRKAYSGTMSFFAEHTGSLLNIKQLNAQDIELKLGKKAVDIMYKGDLYSAALGIFSSFVSGSITSIIAIIIFTLGAADVRGGQITIEELNAFYNIMLVAYSAVSILPAIYTDFMRANGTMFYIGQMIDGEEENYKRGKGMDCPDCDITFENVSFAYDDRNILDNISLTIPVGKLTAVVGENGSGKTTLFKLIERFYEPNEGRISFGDTDVSSIDLDEWRKSIGYVLQNAQLFDGTIRENIAYGVEREVSDEEIMAAAAQAGADEFINGMPEGLDFEVGDDGSRLSAGQRQRIAIARSIMVDPSYLLLDEATSNMDIYAKEEVTRALLGLMEGRTTVMITHDMNMVKKADHIIVLKDGSVEAQGSHEEVKDSVTYNRLMNGGAA
ncbi:MAG: ABC transporter ATP-binding protein/permease [Butyrivibrio sp.]|nr:ABC transporter ATP-binding protein/permease [Butyrivibrio sp.]